MDIDEIFQELSAHMLQGIMFHEQLMNSYLYLGLYGYAACHEYHYLSETKNYIRLNKFKLHHYNGLIKVGNVERSDIIPDSWYMKSRLGVDMETKRKAVMAAFDEWIEWETNTCLYYENRIRDIVSLTNYIPLYEFVKDLILDVENEIVYATNERLKKQSMNFDMVSIIEEQDSLIREFGEKC